MGALTTQVILTERAVYTSRQVVQTWLDSLILRFIPDSLAQATYQQALDERAYQLDWLAQHSSQSATPIYAYHQGAYNGADFAKLRIENFLDPALRASPRLPEELLRAALKAAELPQPPPKPPRRPFE